MYLVAIDKFVFALLRQAHGESYFL
jgi:hypothetical protein